MAEALKAALDITSSGLGTHSMFDYFSVLFQMSKTAALGILDEVTRQLLCQRH